MTWLRTIVEWLGGLGVTTAMALTPLADSRDAFFVGDWLGATVRWRNQRQSFVLLEVIPRPFEPQPRADVLQRVVRAEQLQEPAADTRKARGGK
jgi:hypothetical protein